MYQCRGFVIAGMLLLAPFFGSSQRNYAPHSVLAAGDWYKFSTREPGIYKIDLPFLVSLGIQAHNLSSASFRLFGTGGAMLPEANNGNYRDDLTEIAVQVEDGGDGVLNGTDYILFFSTGPDQWVKDSLNQSFLHKKNLYTGQSFYFITIGGNGKRIGQAPVAGSPTVTVNFFSEHFFHELDTVNFLSGGKEWYGEEFANAPGKILSRNFPLSLPGLQAGAALTLRSQCAARSVGSASRFDIRIDNQPMAQLLLNPVSGGTYDVFVQQATLSSTGTLSSVTPVINYTYTPGSFNSQGWLNWFELFTRRAISLEGNNQLLFRDWQSVGANTAEFAVARANSNTRVWDITDPLSPLKMAGELNGNEYRFVNDCSRLREYAAFTNPGFLQPVAIGKIANQDLHGSTPADLLIVTHTSLLPQARRLALFHQQRDNYRVALVTTEQVYQEFGSGSPDPVAIRDFVKMYYDKYGMVPADKPRFLLLFGDASFDYRDRLFNNTSLVPAWQSSQSADPLSTYASDDFFGFLDDNEDINSGLVSNYLDIGIGRVPAKNAEEAGRFVDKVTTYYDRESMGPWRNNLTFIADDEDGNLHLQDAELITGTATAVAPAFNQQKIYLDAYQQESGAGGSRYPQVNQAINNQVYNGTLIWNYNGHGGSARLAEETILDQSVINNWNNKNRLPLFITATCDFAPYDNPLVNSIGENLLLRPATGAIALMTTTRPVFAFSNRVMNNNYIQYALQAGSDGRYRTLGDAVKEAKNFTYQTLPDISNNRKFTLLGDPAMTLAFPVLKIRPVFINGIPAAQADTLSAQETITIDGEVTDQQGTLLSGFNGNVYPAVFDKPQTITTLGNDPGSQPVPFQAWQTTLFRGKFSVASGRFRISFKMPKDINFQYGNGRLSLYAEDGSLDGQGLFTNFIVGGIGQGGSGDGEGPVIKAWLNDELFANGGLTNQNPVLLLRLADSSGINTTGIGIGHDIVATLDGDNSRYFILNDFYQADQDSYQLGKLRFQLPELSPGPHSLKIKAWDVMNNSSEILLEFMVANDGDLELSHVLNYPNPFTTETRFWFEHNKPGQPLQVQLQVMTITGRVIRSITSSIVPEGNRVTEIIWDGKDDFGSRPGRGVYIYKLRVIAGSKKTKEVLGKLVML
ncbi:MAG: type IX secretion system sortase PorU [Sphingobacteriales bacterium]|nr:type IX secretion system sortase PorU [Sphingobacteriales bacterium]